MDEKQKLFLYVAGSLLLIILIIVGIFSLNNQNKSTCNSPYIQVGDSCCLDENSNSICDSDEKKEPALICKEYSLSMDFGAEYNYTYTIRNPNKIPLTLSCDWVIREWQDVDENKKIVKSFSITVPSNWEKSGEETIILPEEYHHIKMECQKVEDLPECWRE